MNHDGLRPADHKLSAAELVALQANPNAHPKALGHELWATSVAALQQLAYGEHAAEPYLAPVPYELALQAYDELERRALARARLFAEVPGLSQSNDGGGS